LNFSRLHVHNFNGDFLKSTFTTYSVYACNASIEGLRERTEYIDIFLFFRPQVTKRFVVISVGGATRFAMEIFQKVKIGRRVVPNTLYSYYLHCCN